MAIIKHGALLLALVLGTAGAQGLKPEQLPRGLQDWLPWAQLGHGSEQCPQSSGTRECLWPARLELRATATGASFRYEVQVYGEPQWVLLPGDASQWPQDVKSEGRALAVVEREARPALRLAPGRHLIEGQLPWRALPQDLLLPAHIASLSLQLEGQSVVPSLSPEGRLWLRQGQSAEQASDSLVLSVTRLLDDDIPMRLATRFQLVVGGKARELSLPLALLPGWTAERLDSPLPARLQADGSLLIQARPGRWVVQLDSHSLQPRQDLTLPKAEGGGEEVWAFAAHEALRLVSVEGAASVDPRQVEMPEDWRAHPAYRLRPGETLKFTQARRGDADPAPDRLKLSRQLWLDFDGRGYTATDQLQGTLSRSTRLALAPPWRLGRAALDGEDQTITELAGQTGLELRSGALKLSADSRLDGDSRELPVGGWGSELEAAQWQLHLPPGWTLLHASGASEAPGTWLAQWTLWDLFFLMLAVLGTARLHGRRRAALLGLALLLSWQTAGAPSAALWLALLAFGAIVAKLPESRPARVAQWLRHGCVALLLLALLPFAVDQIRLCLYPGLQTQTVAPAREMAAPAAELMQQREEAFSTDKRVEAAPPPPAMKVPPPPSSYLLSKIDPQARVQTGPGLPSWQGEIQSLGWGPVQAAQSVSLWLLPPWATALWRLASLALLALALLRFGQDQRREPGTGASLWPATRPATLAAFSALLLGASLWPADPALAEERQAPKAESAPLTVPSEELLKQLRERVNPAPDCLPQCADDARALLSASGAKLQLRLEVHALAEVAVQLPGQGNQWRPHSVSVDGKSANARRDAQGQLWAVLPKGVSQVLMEADAGGASAVDISLPLPLRELKTQLSGWTLSSGDARGQPGSVVALLREQIVEKGKDSQNNTQRDALPPLVLIERELRLGLQWTVQTRISRLGASRAPLTLRYTLLDGESVDDAGIRVENGQVQLALGSESDLTINSSLKSAPKLVLQALAGASQVEQWRLQAAPMWHVQLGGIAPIERYLDGEWAPLWRPWPGERVELTIGRPAGVAGQTLTIEELSTEITPGQQTSAYRSQLKLRSSLGSSLRVQLPPQAEFRVLKINGETLSLRPQGDLLSVPIRPGQHQLSIEWQQPEGMALWFGNAGLRFADQGGVNDRLTLNVPQDRVVLALGGPPVGPAVLIWGALIVVAGAALLLRRLPGLPLQGRGWLLLGLGLAPVSLAGAGTLLAWFLALRLRQRWITQLDRGAQMVTQLALVLLSLAAAAVLLNTLRVGLLGYPDLMISGNGSSAWQLHWFNDRFQQQGASAWVLSVPLLAYRLLMLLWALWLASAVLNWLRWAWACFSEGGLWPAPRPAAPKREASKD